MTKWAQKRQKSNKKLQISLICSDSQRSFFNEGLDAPNVGLGIEVAVEPFVETSLEVEEEQHQFTSL